MIETVESDYTRLIFTFVVGAMLSTVGQMIHERFDLKETLRYGLFGGAGADGGNMRALSQYLINIPDTDTPRIQECHIMVGHIICQMVEEELF